MIDATFQKVPAQHNTREENEKIRKTETAPEEWSEAKKAQKDIDARWTKKRDRRYFGYKNHVNVDRRHKFIRDYRVTPANVHDSRCLDDLLDETVPDKGVWADSAYSGEVGGGSSLQRSDSSYLRKRVSRSASDARTKRVQPGKIPSSQPRGTRFWSNE